jgi:glyoxylase-like metal-dependent hydrolase (beta-lactamase superfamily II)
MRMLCAVLVVATLCAGAEIGQAGENSNVNSADISDRGLTTSDFPRWKKLVQDVYFYEGLHAPGPDGHIINTGSLIVVTSDGVAVLDGQGDVAQTQAMVATIRTITSQPIKYVIVCSDHGDHTSGNAAFADAFPRVVFISSPASQKVLAKSANPPGETVVDKRTLKMGNTELDILNLGRAHTGGDLVVYLPKSRIMFMSEVYLRGVFPAMRTAYPSEWAQTIEKAQAMDVSWYIPAHGFVDDPARMKRGLEESRQAIKYVIAEGKRLHDAGVPCVVENTQPGKPTALCEAVREANWGPAANLPLRNSQQQAALVRIYQELDGKLP